MLIKFKKAGQSACTEGFNSKLKLLLNKLHNNYGYFFNYDINEKFATLEINKFVESELTKAIKNNSSLQKELNLFIFEILNNETDYKSEQFMDLLNPIVFESNKFINDRLNLALFLLLDNKRFRQYLDQYSHEILSPNYTIENYKILLKDKIIPSVVRNF